MAVIEYTRNILGYKNANSEEFVPMSATHPLDTAVVFMPEGSRDTMGGTMRLGSRTTMLKDNTIAMTLYNQKHSSHNTNDSNNNNSAYNNISAEMEQKVKSVEERHRHRYEVNPNLVSLLEARGMIFSGKDITGERMEIIELPKSTHPYFIGCQFHPEYKSRPLRPAPTFLGLLQAIKDNKKLKKL